MLRLKDLRTLNKRTANNSFLTWFALMPLSFNIKSIEGLDY